MYKYHSVDSIQASTISSDSWTCTRSVKPEQNLQCSIQSFRTWCGELRNILKTNMLCCYIWYNQGCATSAELSCLACFTLQLLKIITCKCMYSCAVIIELPTSKQETCYGWGKPNNSTFPVLLLNLFHPSYGGDIMTLSMGISNRSGC